MSLKLIVIPATQILIFNKCIAIPIELPHHINYVVNSLFRKLLTKFLIRKAHKT